MTAGCLHRSPAITEKSPLPMRSTSRLMSVLFLASDEAVGTVPPQRGPRPLTANELTAATGDSVQISHPRRLSADLATSSPVNYQGGGCPDCSPRRIPSTSPLLVSLILKRKHYPRACPWLRCSSPPTTALAGNLGTQADQQADERRACRPCVPTYRARMHQQQRSTGKSRSRVRTGLTCSRRLSTETFFLFLVLLIRLSSLEKFSPHTRSRADGLNRSHGCSCS
ncbi:hypothetical protein IWX91DRAFT_349152 [Phyllosticta citricarpa]